MYALKHTTSIITIREQHCHVKKIQPFTKNKKITKSAMLCIKKIRNTHCTKNIRCRKEFCCSFLCLYVWLFFLFISTVFFLFVCVCVLFCFVLMFVTVFIYRCLYFRLSFFPPPPRLMYLYAISFLLLSFKYSFIFVCCFLLLFKLHV